MLARMELQKASPLLLSTCLYLAGIGAFGQTSLVDITSLSPATVAPNGAITVQMKITNTGTTSWDPASTFSCGEFYDFQSLSGYNALCHPYPQEAGAYGIRLEVHFLDSADPTNTYYISDLAFPQPIAAGETIALTRVLRASLPPGRYRMALITLRHFWFAFTSRTLYSPSDSLALGATADFVVAEDVTPPAIVTTGALSGSCSLWPPNGKLVSVGTVSASDSENAVASLQVDVTSTDPTMVPAQDAVVEGGTIGPLSVKLRARRPGYGGDRVYDLTITAKDMIGNSAVTKTQCVVPHDQGK